MGNPTIKMKMTAGNDGIMDIQIETKKKKAYFDLLPKDILQRYQELGVDMNDVDESGYITYLSCGRSKQREYSMELQDVLKFKGFEIEYKNDKSEELFRLLEKKLSKKLGKDISGSMFLWSHIHNRVPYEKQFALLENKINNNSSILFFGAHLNMKTTKGLNHVFKVKSFKYQPLRNYQWLTEFDDYNSPFIYETYYNGEYVPNECFIADKDLTWVFCFNHEGYFIYSDL